MKKLIAMLCMLTCLVGLSACGQAPSADALAHEQSKGEAAQLLATDIIVPYMLTQYYGEDGSVADQKAELHQECYNVHELADMTKSDLDAIIYMITSSYEGISFGVDTVEIDGNGILNGIVSISSAYEELGDVDMSSRMDADYEISGDQIIVTVYLTGSKLNDDGKQQTAEMEVIFTNDIFLKVEACTLNVDQTMGELMTKAAMDTVMGMTVVFSVLILICIIIWALGFIPKIQDMFGGNNKKEKVQTIKEEAVDKTIAQIIAKEESAVVNTTDDLELVAVIAAAIAASQGAVSTDGFVVRSIRKRR